MKKIKKKINVDVDIYISSDGKEFETKGNCEYHERQLRVKNLIKQMSKAGIYISPTFNERGALSASYEDRNKTITKDVCNILEEFDAFIGEYNFVKFFYLKEFSKKNISLIKEYCIEKDDSSYNEIIRCLDGISAEGLYFFVYREGKFFSLTDIKEYINKKVFNLKKVSDGIDESFNSLIRKINK